MSLEASVRPVVLSHLWVDLGPGISDYRALGVLELMLSHCWEMLAVDIAGVS